MATFIFGHKSPDTDTVCSSIALSYLKNQEGNDTEPRVLGNINNETKFVLNYFNTPVPSYLNDVRVRIKDVQYDDIAYINENKSIDEAFKTMQKQNITAIPLIDKEQKLTGYVTLKELAKYLIGGSKEYIETTLSNIIETLDAKVIVKCDEDIKGKILLAGLQTKTIKEYTLTNEDILIIGDRYRVLEYAIDCGVKLIILPYNVDLDPELLKKAEAKHVNIIASPLDSFNIAAKITLSNYVKNININKSPITVNVEDCYADFKTMSHKINHTNYPVINNKNECLGLIRLTGPNEYEKQKVILVDHNNLAQSVDGIEEADIVEIKAKEKTENTSGFWWCGRYGMHKWDMPIEDIDMDLKSYKKIVIVSPIWVFSVSAPIREFCHKYSKDINSVEYIFTHFMNVSFKNVADEVDGILNKKREKFTSVCTRLGKVKERKIL